MSLLPQLFFWLCDTDKHRHLNVSYYNGNTRRTVSVLTWKQIDKARSDKLERVIFFSEELGGDCVFQNLN